MYLLLLVVLSIICELQDKIFSSLEKIDEYAYIVNMIIFPAAYVTFAVIVSPLPISTGDLK